jgi:hypothetical protein
LASSKPAGRARRGRSHGDNRPAILAARSRLAGARARGFIAGSPRDRRAAGSPSAMRTRRRTVAGERGARSAASVSTLRGEPNRRKPASREMELHLVSGPRGAKKR